MARPRRVPRKRIPDTVVGKGLITKTVPGSLLDTSSIAEGTRVEIARIILTPIGLRFRIISTNRWIPEDSIKCDFDPSVVVDYNQCIIDARNNEKSGSTAKKQGLSQKRDNQILKGLKPGKDCVKPVRISTSDQNGPWNKVHKKTYGTQGRINLMDKKDLKTAIVSLTPGDRVSVTFLSTMPTGAQNTRYDGIREFAGQTVDFTMVETKKGRGKGGSQLVVLKTADDRKVTTGTPHSDVLLKMVTPTGTYGHESETDVPRSFETNAGQASELKNVFKGLVDRTGARVRLESNEKDFNGEFAVTGVKKLRGRHGQICLDLRADDDRTVTVWSYRHSGVISKFEVLDAGTVSVTAKSEASESTVEEESAERV